MAEPRRQHDTEGERRDLRGARSRNQATDQPERTKREHLHHSQGPLSSLRAVIKRTRSNSQCEHYRDRRRPEITIVSAEPLCSNGWFSGPSVVFPSLPQPSWSSHVQTVSQPPPSYDQVIQEKTQEKPTAAPRQTTVISTSATQTDPERESTTTTTTTVPQRSAAPQSAGKKTSAGKKPQKPPRPSLPRPADTQTVSQTLGTDATASTSTEDRRGSKVAPEQPRRADPIQTCSRSVTVHWDFPVNHLSAPETTPSPSHSEPQPRPVPLPRRKYQKVRVQSLVSLSEGCDPVHTDPEYESSNKYLKELLEVFSADNTREERSDVVDQSDEAFRSEDAVGEMNTSSHRNIQARIQAFESQACPEEENAAEPVRPEPRPRKATVKPPVAAKPPVALKPPSNHSADDDSQNVSYINANHTPAARPQPPRKPVGMSIKEELETLHSKGAVPHRSRPPGLTRANSVYEEEPSPLPPVPPVKPSKEPLKPNLNINNHNSASMFNENALAHHMPVEPERNADSNGASFPRQSVTRRPTTIRVPSRAASLADHIQDTAPPLPVQKPVGSMKTSAPLRQSSMPILPPQPGPEPSLPPRRQSKTKTLPPRPPSVKPGPGRPPPPPSLQATGQSVSLPWQVSPKPQTQASHRKRPVLPPRPSPGHRLYNKYTLELPHGIAALDYKGSGSTGELSLQKNEVLLLVEEIDQNMFECQIGELKGRVHKSRMKVITPLASDMSATQGPGPGPGPSASDGGSTGQRMQVIYDFNPEGPGELGLKAGDLVTMVEPVDSEWCRGTCRGSTGFFPVNYVKALSDSPKPLPERKPKPPSAAVGGPRCKARFDFEGEHSDELSFTEGDVIQLKEYCGQDWARGQIGAVSGIFPLNFVEIIEDLPPPPGRQQPQPKSIALPGMVPSPTANTEFAKPSQASQSSVDWAVAQFDYAGKSDEDLSFQQGDRILVTQRLDAEWSRGRLNGREGMFPTAFVESSTAGQQSLTLQQNEVALSGDRGRALYDFTADCDEELSLQFGDIITNLESLDEEWFMGDLRGKRALVPKNYLQVL